MQKNYLYFSAVIICIFFQTTVVSHNDHDLESLFDAIKNINLTESSLHNELGLGHNDVYPNECMLQAQESFDEIQSSTEVSHQCKTPEYLQKESDDKEYKDVTVENIPHVPGSTVVMTIANPVGVVAVVTTVVTILVIDRLAKMKILSPAWTLEQMREKIFGVVVYEGDDYYKNWRNPKNLERKFPSVLTHQGALLERAVYEKEMSNWLTVVENFMIQQQALQELPWPDDLYKKLLDFTFVVDPVYISEDEELQLDKRLTFELANCRASVIASIKLQIAQMYRLLDSFAHKIIDDVNDLVQDVKKFKIDYKLVIMLGLMVTGVCVQDESDSGTSYADDLDVCLAGLDKKSMTKLCTHASEYEALLEDLDAMVACSAQFFENCKPRQIRSGNDNVIDARVQSVADMIAQKKKQVVACLEQIALYCKKTGQTKMLPDLFKYLKKMSVQRFKKYHKNNKIELNLQDMQKFDLEKLLSLFVNNIFDHHN
ncbi:hypothetical protein [Candidatus Chromulinivorax destructor]|uniref:Uncharacterized protein n=1 Tax=Candidatus Chromulinivorax destructor TaxID=2066483 RepID=A0A345ZAM9_9BACT|nr:hypothetical protein [Candidatus Chromulinivorax destructor]AXK60346.1 hypothetical protein C0J27_01095 [Candidatus Chromulinivorax destructor]